MNDPREAFDHLHRALVEYQLRFIDLCIKGSGLSLLILGWMLTSKDARAFIAASPVGRGAAVAGILVMTAATVLLCVRLNHVIRRLKREMMELNYFPLSYYEFRVLSTPVAVSVVTLAVAPSAVSIAVMLFGLT